MRNDILDLRAVIKKLVPILTKKGLRVTQIGAEAYVRANPKTNQPEIVNIPSVGDNATPEFIMAIQGFIDHEVAHVLLTDFSIYGTDPRKPNGLATKKFVELHNMVEDTMIEREIVKIFPGSKKNLSVTRRYFLENVTKPVLKEAKTPQEQYHYLLVVVLRALAGHEEMQEFMDKGNHWKNPVIEQFVDAISSSTKQALQTSTSTKETLQIALDIAEIMERHDPPSEAEQFGEMLAQVEIKQGQGKGEEWEIEIDITPQPNELSESADKAEDEKSDEPDDGDKDDNQNKKDTASNNTGGKNKDNQDAEQSKANDGSGEDVEDNMTNGQSGSLDSNKPENSGNDQNDGSDGGTTPLTHRLSGGEGNEVDDLVDGEVKGGGGGVGGNQSNSSIFDVPDEALQTADISKQIAIKISQASSELIDAADYSVFTRDYDKIEPLKTPDKINEAWIPTMRQETRKMVGVMQKSIERMLASQSMVANIPGFKRGRLHAPSLYRLTHADPRIFSQRHEAKSKDTAVCLLVDNSGSMYGEKMHLAMLSAYALSETLEKVRIRHEVLGFTTMGYNHIPRSLSKAIKEQAYNAESKFDRVYPIAMPIYKNFNERVDATVRKRMAYAMNAQNDLCQNIDGESLLYAVDRLSKQREKRKVIIVLSDGQPAGCRHAGAHLRYAVRRVEASGIECIGIGIKDDSVERYYSKHIVLEELEALPALVMQQLHKILTH